ncbi:MULTISPECIES: LPS export ABC transporter permease LptF [Rhodobacterales]|uniref:LPS export ABC transporter permease LptF n=1 Tax=Roseobacter sp. N2S TaxID=2663844 RepID=UPI00285C64AB|nr:MULTISPECIES: LPS export ABC transporter permease LptF [Rhodobacterales]MDR6265137.1 lipopolysaccharide export system permease protein [Roseobacter sp. N2S]
MKRIDRYVLRQLVGPFLFFLVIFGGILWLNQALRIVDVVVSNGQSGLVFAELSVYLLPKVLETVVPVAAFACAIYLTNRLYSEAELVVFMGVGHGPANATVPFFAFGMICFLLMSILTHVLTPWSLSVLQNRQHEISKEFLTQFVVAGEFASPTDGVTVFFGETTPEGNLRDVLINDRRDESVIVTHTAASGQLISSENKPKLVLFDGSIQQFEPEARKLSTIQFDSLSYDLSQFAKNIGERTVAAREMYSWDLAFASVEGASLELHDRFVKSLLAIVVPVLGAIVLLSAGFSRNGFFLRIALGVVFMVAINSARGVFQGFAESDTGSWPLIYVPVLVAFLAVLFMVRMGQAPWKSGLRGIISPQKASL